MIHPPSWPGFVPVIDVLAASEEEDVDARNKSGHDDSLRIAPFGFAVGATANGLAPAELGGSNAA
jgi:hypothetical protein